MYNEDDYLLMSGIQHFAFCRRQWALIHIEQQWSENVRTASGRVEHSRCHDSSVTERRGNLLTVRGMRVISHALKLTGDCDVVEFRLDPEGVNINGLEGTWLPSPVEYKHGHNKGNDVDHVQLCAQAMAIEEMLVCSISQGAIFYEETRRREIVSFTEELRNKTMQMAEEMWQLYKKGYTPKVKTGTFCNACSLKDLCLPKLCGKLTVTAYIDNALEKDE